MTSDMMQSKYLPQLAKGLLFRKQPLDESSRRVKQKIRMAKIELTRDVNFLDGTHDIFDVLSKNENAHSALKDSLTQTIGVLEEADAVLKTAEASLLEKDRRIETLQDLWGIDPVTGFLNSRGFKKALIAEVARTNRGHNDGGLVVMFCLENFESIQSTYGQDAADKTLALVAKAMENEIRPMDWAAHINDDEFVLLFSNTHMADALHRLQNMALRLNRLSLIWGGDELHLSLSLGLKSYTKGDKAEDVFKTASDDLKRNRSAARS